MCYQLESLVVLDHAIHVVIRVLTSTSTELLKTTDIVVTTLVMWCGELGRNCAWIWATWKPIYRMKNEQIYVKLYVGTRWRCLLRHCATNRKVSGSVPDGITGIFRWHNPSGCSMVLGSTHPITEMESTQPIT